MSFSRRDLLKAGLTATALMAAPRPLLARFGRRWEPAPPIQDPRVKDLALRALEAARAAGAAYADVRLTHTRSRSFLTRVADVRDGEQVVVGARALVDGYWGFASSPVWDVEEMGRLGREAVHQAKVHALGPARAVELAPVPAVRDGHWVMPVAIDPLEVSPLEIADYLEGLRLFVSRFPDFIPLAPSYSCQVQEKAFASSEGSYCTQRVYRSEGDVKLQLKQNGQPVYDGALDTLTPAGVGWELFKGQPIREQVRRLMEDMKDEWKLPEKPVAVGRYDTVCDAWTVARLLDQTLGRATELDRALGYEANAGGTSYLTEPLAMVGSYQAGAPTLTVTANRAEPGGAATVAWDDEGVKPDEFALVRDGILVDFQTTRESAGWLKAHYAKTGAPLRSHGCAAAPSALEAPLTHTPNLTLAPGRGTRDVDELIAGMGTGLAVKGGALEMDFQGQSGLGRGRVFEVKRGKQVARVVGAGFLFRANELWKRLAALGGPAGRRRYGLGSSKGEPAQHTYHSVTAPPAAFEQLTVIDVLRKA
ncbi:MAG TPA: TldD/PmbA family protein [Gemmatimonadales bacterium]|nr:TldD/PmbA family protein [Gemmatimonadales bacterium]